MMSVEERDTKLVYEPATPTFLLPQVQPLAPPEPVLQTQVFARGSLPPPPLVIGTREYIAIARLGRNNF
jgi:hypothetical protein